MVSLITAQYNLKGIVSFQEQANKFVHSKKKKKEKEKGVLQQKGIHDSHV